MRNYVETVRGMLLYRVPSLAEQPELLAMYVLLVLTTGTKTSLENVHDAWSVWQNERNSLHRSLIPFDQLAVDVQEMYRMYCNAIVAVAQGLIDEKPKPDWHE